MGESIDDLRQSSSCEMRKAGFVLGFSSQIKERLIKNCGAPGEI